MTFKRRLLATLTLTILAIMIGLTFFALPTTRRAAATTWHLLTATPSATFAPILIGDTLDPSGQPRLPVMEDVKGRLLFTYQRNLYLAGFDGEPAQVIAYDVPPSTIHLAPDQQSLVYWRQERGGIDKKMTILNLVNLENLTTSTLMTFYGQVGLIRWSPDGVWLAVELKRGEDNNSNLLGTLVADRTQPIPPTLLNDYGVATWLTDNRLILTSGTGDSAQFAVYTPNSGDPSPLDVPAEQIPTLQGIRSIYSSNYASATAILVSLGLSPVWTPTYLYNPELGVAPDNTRWVAGETANEIVCQPYQVVVHTIADNSTTTLAEFAEPYTLRLANFQWATDDSLYFVRWSSRTCPADLGQSSAQLYRLVADTPPVLIGDHLLTEVFLHSYAVAPDGQSVTWVGYDVTNQTSFLGMADVQTGVVQQLISLKTATYPIGFTSVWWLP